MPRAVFKNQNNAAWIRIELGDRNYLIVHLFNCSFETPARQGGLRNSGLPYPGKYLKSFPVIYQDRM